MKIHLFEVNTLIIASLTCISPSATSNADSSDAFICNHSAPLSSQENPATDRNVESEDSEELIEDGGRRRSITIQHKYLTANGIRFHYVEYIPEEIKGSPVLFVHGFPDFWYGWRNQLVEMGLQGNQVIALDSRGYNLTDAPQEKKAYHVQHLACDIAEFTKVKFEGEKVNLVAHDFGALMAWFSVYLYPQLYLHFISINAPHPYQFKMMNNDLHFKVAQYLRIYYIGIFRLPEVAERLFSRIGYERGFELSIGNYFVNKEKLTQPIIDRYIESWKKTDRMTSMINYYRANPPFKIHKSLDREFWFIQVPNIQFTTIYGVAHGVNQVFKAHFFTKTINQIIPQMAAFEIQGASNLPHFDTPEKVNEILVSRAKN